MGARRAGNSAGPSTHNCLSYASSPAQGEFDGRVHGNFRANNNESLRDHGIALLPTYVVWPNLQGGRLHRLFADAAVRGNCRRHIQFVCLNSRFIAPKLRGFVDNCLVHNTL